MRGTSSSVALGKGCSERDQSLVVPWAQKWHVLPASQSLDWPVGKRLEILLKAEQQILVEFEALSAFGRMIQDHASKWEFPAFQDDPGPEIPEYVYFGLCEPDEAMTKNILCWFLRKNFPSNLAPS